MTDEPYTLAELLTVADAAELLGIKERRMQAIINELGLGRRFGRAHILTPADVETARNRRGPGQPKKETIPIPHRYDDGDGNMGQNYGQVCITCHKTRRNHDA